MARGQRQLCAPAAFSLSEANRLPVGSATRTDLLINENMDNEVIKVAARWLYNNSYVSQTSGGVTFNYTSKDDFIKAFAGEVIDLLAGGAPHPKH